MARHKWNSKQLAIFGFLTGLFFVSLIVMRTEGASGWIMGLVGTIFVFVLGFVADRFNQTVSRKDNRNAPGDDSVNSKQDRS